MTPPDPSRLPDARAAPASRDASASAAVDAHAARLGVAFALGAYLWWGFVALYFKAIVHVPPLEVLAHRVLHLAWLLLLVLALRGRLGALVAALRSARVWRWLLLSTALIAVNWLLFIWAVFQDQVLQASLGYYINPLLSIALGFVVLGERLRRLQTLAVLLALLGVVQLTVTYGALPWLALSLASSFALYGLVRKLMPVEGMVGLLCEATLLAPIALGYLLWLDVHDRLVFAHLNLATDGLLVLGGAMTAIPLSLFLAGVRRLRLATVGLLQYIAPTLQLLLAVFAFGEAFTRAHALTFACVWLAIALYAVDSWRATRAAAAQPRRR
ncbi:MAG: EamA family transporter RarD [Acidobacteriota bacterium]